MELEAEYKQTEVGVIPVDWNIDSLQNLTAFITKGSTPTTYGFKWKQTGVLFLRSECVSEKGLDLTESMRISPEAHALLRRSEVREGDILITITGNVGRVVLLTGVECANINQHIARLRITATEVDTAYVYHFISQASVRRYYSSIVTGQAYPQISLKQVRETPIPLPPTKPEQTAIASALSDADALIQSLTRLIAKKRQIKQGAMQTLLNPYENGRIKAAWMVKKLGKIGATYGGLSGKTKSDFGTGAAYFIPFMNVMSNIIIDIEYIERVRVGKNDSQNNARKGDLFFNGSSETPDELGLCAVLNDAIDNLYLNSFCFGFRLFDEKEVYARYLAYFFRSNYGRELLYSLAQGATRYNLSKTNFMKLEVPMPDYAGQSKIATTISDMDADIAALETKLAKYQQIKQGMMQNLLTGRIRLVKPETKAEAAA
ncbi:MAG: restriction endonuclease subunit S [Pseudomonadales bacterium]|nr:restriction endonuclease subunit S [Pseudomonadales bacterium]